MSDPVDRSAAAPLILALTLLGLLLGALLIEASLLSWLIGEIRMLAMLGGALLGALTARLILLERRIRRLESDHRPATEEPLPPRPSPVSVAAEVPPSRQPAPSPSPKPLDAASSPSAAAHKRSSGIGRWLIDWFSQGNVPVKVGLLVSLIGVAALLRYATDQGWLSAPIEIRLAAVAAAAVAALIFAWRERQRRRLFAVSLQGGAIGVLALTIFAALRLYQLLPASAAFALLVVVVAAAAVLAVAQQSLALAVLALITGFAAPLLVSTGEGSHLALFGWYAVLNLAMLGIARHRYWPLLYRLGFAFTFVIGAAWGYLRYSPEHFASTQSFLALFFVLYFAIPILVELRRPAAESHRVDAVLVFGLPLFWLPLQAGLFEGRQLSIAAAALAGSGLYLASALWLLRRRNIPRLGRAHAVLAIALATVAVPFAFAGSTVVMIWALEGAALVWFGLEDRSRLARLGGLALTSVAMAIWLLWLVVDASRGPLLVNATFLGGLSLTVAAAVCAWRYHDRDASAWLVNLLAAAALLPWVLAGAYEIEHNVPASRAAEALLVWAGLSALLAAAAHRARSWPVTALASAFALALGVPAALHQMALHQWPWGGLGGLAWAGYVIFAWLARRQLQAAAPCWQALTAIGIQAALAVMLAGVLLHVADDRLGLAGGWHWLAAGLPLVMLLAWMQADRTPLPGPPLPAGSVRYWPLRTALAAAVFGLLLSLAEPGRADPLPFVPVLNPLELLQAAVLLLLTRSAGPAAVDHHRGWVPWIAVLTAMIVTMAALRAVHHLSGIAWTSSAMLASQNAQATLTVTWTALGVIAWVAGSRRGLRGLWLAGALVLGAVLLKLIVVDRSFLSNVAGIVSFLGFGLLSVLVGYLAPAPPRNEGTSS